MRAQKPLVWLPACHRNLDLSDPEKERIREDQANERAAKDRDFRLALGNAETPEAKLDMLDDRAAEQETLISSGKTAKAQ